MSKGSTIPQISNKIGVTDQTYYRWRKEYGSLSVDQAKRLKEIEIELATKYVRYGYRRITALLQREGFEVNHKRVERLWRKAGLKVPQKQPKRKRLWFNDGSCVRLKPKFKDHVWSYDFVATRTE